MAQIANQDHLFIKVDSIEENILTEEQKASLAEKYRQGVLLDVVLYDDLATSKIISYEVVEGELSIFCAFEQSIHMIDVDL